MTGAVALRWLIVGAVMAAAAWIGFGLMMEAYGSGPPHHGGTTNMDKWTSPWPVFIAITGLACLLVAIIAPWRSLRK